MRGGEWPERVSVRTRWGARRRVGATAGRCALRAMMTEKRREVGGATLVEPRLTNLGSSLVPWPKRKGPLTRALLFLAGGLGFEPRLTESESVVLPLDDPPSFCRKRPRPFRHRSRA